MGCFAGGLKVAYDFLLNFPACRQNVQLIYTYLNSVLVLVYIWVQSRQTWGAEKRNYGIVGLKRKKKLEVYWDVSYLAKIVKMKGAWSAHCFSIAPHGVGETLVPNRPGFKCWLCHLPAWTGWGTVVWTFWALVSLCVKMETASSSKCWWKD